jgi:hypothetical protein
MLFRRITGTLLGVLLVALGGFLGVDALRGDAPARWWFPIAAVAPGTIILGFTWLTWSTQKQRKADVGGLADRGGSSQ